MPTADSMRQNVVILAMCQALAMSGTTLVIAVSVLVGAVLAPSPIMATVPLAVQFLATMATTIPASLFMAKVGRRFGFTLGQCLGIVGAALSAYAIFLGSFPLFVVAAALLGAHNAFWQYFRFAAADVATPDYRSKAISYVMAGGVAAAVAGPQLAKWTSDLASAAFAASYLAIIALCILAIILLQFIEIPKPQINKMSEGGRPIGEIMRTPVFMVAALSSMVGYGAMNFLMTSTPLAMKVCGFAFVDSATVIQWHALGMFLPSFFTGHLIRRFGVLNVIMAGVVLNAGAIMVALSGIEFANFWAGLVLLGVGWNFMFIGGTSLLTEAYSVEERAKTQAAHDFLVFGMVAASALGSGIMHELLGWASVNLLAAVPIAATFFIVMWFRGYASRVPAE